MISVTLQVPDAFTIYMRQIVAVAADQPIREADVQQFVAGVFAAYLDASQLHDVAATFIALNELVEDP